GRGAGGGASGRPGIDPPSMSDQLSQSSPSDRGRDDLDPGPVEEALRAFAAALRSYRLYEGNNPMLDRFVLALRQKLGGLWAELPDLRLDVEEDRLLWQGHEVFP